MIPDPFLVVLLWLGLAIFTVGLAILLYSGWGRSRPLRKCMALSLFAHLLLAGYAATVETFAPVDSPVDQVLHVSLADGPDDGAPETPKAQHPTATVETKLAQNSDNEAPKAQRPTPAVETKLAQNSADDKALANEKSPAVLPPPPSTLRPPPSTASEDVPAALLQPIAQTPTIAHTGDENKGEELAARGKPEPKLLRIPANPGHGGQSVPDAYRLRVAPDRARVAASHGGADATEAAVRAALRWLADNQAADGRWDPRAHHAGREGNVLGRNHYGAGSRADTGITGLALLSFLGAGHTHFDGPYREDVRRGLEYLIRTQAPDGNLGAHSAPFESMYCHAMAACALSEAYGLTRDAALLEPVRRAVGYTLAAQDPIGGGWRYRAGDPGDTSQLGWQLMLLKSAELAGIPMPERARQRILRFLQSVSSGNYGGLASYRPGEPPTRSMTAEALVCRQFLGIPREHPACGEAADCLLGESPGEGVYNLYYWYYGTFAMYQFQDARWQQWNEALQATLVAGQVKAGPLAGSWDTNDLWGGHGSRVYTTALATLTLEVYYRFLPIYGGDIGVP